MFVFAKRNNRGKKKKKNWQRGKKPVPSCGWPLLCASITGFLPSVRIQTHKPRKNKTTNVYDKEDVWDQINNTRSCELMTTLNCHALQGLV